jgi:hypothetical protein
LPAKPDCIINIEEGHNKRRIELRLMCGGGLACNQIEDRVCRGNEVMSVQNQTKPRKREGND